MKQSRRNPHKGGHAEASAHKGERANHVVCAEAVPPCARQKGGVSRERKAAHNSPRQSAWVLCLWACLRGFVGFFGLVGFGGLGVFWGCLACFLVF